MTNWLNVAEHMASELGGFETPRGWKALCPVHESDGKQHEPSFEFEMKGDKLVFICRAGCQQREVYQALVDRGLWPKGRVGESSPFERTATYTYITDSGEVCYKDRLEGISHGKRTKKFTWRTDEGDGLGTAHALLYRSEKLRQHPDLPVVLVEGEKCVHVVEEALGDDVVAVCSPNGDKAEWELHAPQLKGRTVVVLPDNDEAGYRYLGSVLKALTGVAKKVSWVQLPSLAEKDDVYDWLKQGNSVSDLRKLLFPADDSKPKRKPHHLEAERIVIGAALHRHGDAIEAARLAADEFYHPPHQTIWQAMLDLYEQGKPLGSVTVRDYLAARNKLKGVGGEAYFDALEEAGSTNYTEYVTEHAALIRRFAVQRNLIEAAERIQKIGWDSTLDSDDALQAAWNEVESVTTKHVSGDFRAMGSVLDSVEERLELLAARNGEYTGLATGFTDLDRMTSGLQNDDLIYLAARPSMGKTALALNIAHHMACKLGVAVGIFSLEMAAEQLALRLIALDAEVNSNHLRTGYLTKEEAERVRSSMDRLRTTQILIDDTPGISVMELKAKAKRVHRERGVGLIVIDYVGLMLQNSANVVQEMSAISRSLKSLARELHIPVLALSQLSRKVEERADKRPMLSDLRESGALEQDADMVWFPYRDEYYNEDSDDKGVAELDVAKHRNGPTGTIFLSFKEELMRFRDLDQTERIPGHLEAMADTNPFAALKLAEIQNGAA